MNVFVNRGGFVVAGGKGDFILLKYMSLVNLLQKSILWFKNMFVEKKDYFRITFDSIMISNDIFDNLQKSI